MNGGFCFDFPSEEEDDCTVLVSSNGAELVIPLVLSDPEPIVFKRGGKWYLIYYQTTNEEECMGELRVVDDRLNPVSTKEVSMLVESVAWDGDRFWISGRAFNQVDIPVEDFF